jgi:hypothetical protein
MCHRFVAPEEAQQCLKVLTKRNGLDSRKKMVSNNMLKKIAANFC